MRPTIPLAEWRLAIDLEATRSIDALTAPPARGCSCVDCERWAASDASLLPAPLRAELERIGINPAHPTDVYATGQSESGVVTRVSYFAVGRIISGPAEFTQSGAASVSRNYVTLRPPPRLLALAVAYQASIGVTPDWASESMQPLLAIDLWVDVPHTTQISDQAIPHGRRQAAV